MPFKFSDKKKSLRVHECDELGNTYCKVENGSRRKMVMSDIFPAGRKPCSVCRSLREAGVDPNRKTVKAKAYENHLRKAKLMDDLEAFLDAAEAEYSQDHHCHTVLHGWAIDRQFGKGQLG